MEEEILLSPEGYEKLDKELQHLRTVKRREIARTIKQARELGDISENAEYEEAKNSQAFVEGRIITLENILRHAIVVDGADGDPSEVTIGSVVTLRDTSSGAQHSYIIVGSPEADPRSKKISYLSPVGKAVFGKKEGDVVRAKLPKGTVSYEITSVERN